MSGSGLKQRLAAILAADVAGYARLMAADQRGTVTALDNARAVVRSHVEANQGRVVDMVGDSVLAVFETATGAVTAAVAIQGELESSADASEERRMRFRIGVHLGDVIEKTDGTVYGDGVNIAARLQALAEPGGVWISDAVQGVLSGGVAERFADQGERKVKNIARPVRAFALRANATAAAGRASRRRRRVTGAELAVLSMLLVLGGGLVLLYDRRDEPTPDAATAGKAPPAPAASDDRPAIAVLPFVNMSSDPDQEYFSDGISEELLNLLAKIPELRVISRSSAFSYKGKDVKLAQIAEELNVAHILEGSVRKSGNKVRIAAQLIDARSDTHLWSQTWDRELDDIFAVQDEIAAEVVGRLKVTLLGEAPKVKAVSPDAYALFLQGRQLARQGTPEGWEQSITLYQQALAVDPGYAAAWDGLATVYANQVGLGLRPGEEGVRLAREAAGKALAIDPDFALAYSRLGWIAMFFDGDLGAAARHYAHALALEPANIAVIGNAAALASILNRLDTAIALREYAIARDPVNPAGHFNLGLDYLYAGRLDEAVASFRGALRLSPEYASAHFSIGQAMLQQGRAQAALAEMRHESDEVWRLLGLAMVYRTLGRNADSDAALAEAIAKYAADWAYNIAYVLAWRNEPDRAFEWLDKAVAQQDAGLSEIASNPLFANLHDDPRWLPFLRKVGKAPEQLAVIKFDVKVPRQPRGVLSRH